MDSTDPLGLVKELFTREFYRNCFEALRDDDILINQHESPYYAMMREVKGCMKRPNHFLSIESISPYPHYPRGIGSLAYLKKYDPIKDLVRSVGSYGLKDAILQYDATSWAFLTQLRLALAWKRIDV